VAVAAAAAAAASRRQCSVGGGTNNQQSTKSSDCRGDGNGDEDDSDDDDNGNEGDGGNLRGQGRSGGHAHLASLRRKQRPPRDLCVGLLGNGDMCLAYAVRRRFVEVTLYRIPRHETT
jgi:hypothetical protein